MTITPEQLAHLTYGLGASSPDWGFYLGFDSEKPIRSAGLAYTLPRCFSAFGLNVVNCSRGPNTPIGPTRRLPSKRDAFA
jgi:hypothetical protein